MISSFDAGRGCPFLCSFCTIINVQGRKSRYRTADDIERIVRANHANGVRYFFITDDNLARNRNWEDIFDRLIRLRQEGIYSPLRDPGRHDVPQDPALRRKGGGGGGQAGVHRAREHQSRQSQRREEEAEPHLRLSRDAAGVAQRRCITYCGYIIGFPNDTPVVSSSDIKMIQRELPLDILEFSCLTPLPGSEDHAKAVARGSTSTRT